MIDHRMISIHHFEFDVCDRDSTSPTNVFCWLVLLDINFDVNKTGVIVNYLVAFTHRFAPVENCFFDGARTSADAGAACRSCWSCRSSWSRWTA